MLTVKKVSPLYNNKPDHIEVIGRGDNQQEAIEALRAHFLKTNQRIINLSNEMIVPRCILNLAKRNIARNKDLDITVREDGIVFVDGQGPEMDYYTIT